MLLVSTDRDWLAWLPLRLRCCRCHPPADKSLPRTVIHAAARPLGYATPLPLPLPRDSLCPTLLVLLPWPSLGLHLFSVHVTDHDGKIDGLEGKNISCSFLVPTITIAIAVAITVAITHASQSHPCVPFPLSPLSAISTKIHFFHCTPCG